MYRINVALQVTFKLQPASLARAYFRLVGCSDCCRLFIFFTNILKIIVVLLGYTKISRIFVKEITTKTKEIMTTITETKGFKIEFNGSKTYFVTDEHGQVWARTETLRTATNKLNKILTQSGLN